MTDVPDLVIFDCDGVLVDSETLACGVQSRAFAAHGLDLPPAEVARRFLGASAKDMRAAILRDFGVALPADHEARAAGELAALFRAELAPVPGIREVVGSAATRGAVCVASSSSPERIALALGITGLAPLFGAHVFSAVEVANGKPAPDLFLHAAARMGVPPGRAWVVEDSVNGVRAARAAQMRVLGFLGGRHCPSGHGEALSAAGANVVCGDAPALARALDLAAGRPGG